MISARHPVHIHIYTAAYCSGTCEHAAAITIRHLLIGFHFTSHQIPRLACNNSPVLPLLLLNFATRLALYVYTYEIYYTTRSRYFCRVTFFFLRPYIARTALVHTDSYIGGALWVEEFERIYRVSRTTCGCIFERRKTRDVTLLYRGAKFFIDPSDSLITPGCTRTNIELERRYSADFGKGIHDLIRDSHLTFVEQV